MRETFIRLWECGVCEEWFHKRWRDLPQCPFCNSLHDQVANPEE